LVGTNPDKIEDAFKILLSSKWKQGSSPELWDGKSAERIINHLVEIHQS
jgi:UDP-N-acetylglucosamine 2-epimerase (non-hydrolysing)